MPNGVQVIYGDHASLALAAQTPSAPQLTAYPGAPVYYQMPAAIPQYAPPPIEVS